MIKKARTNVRQIWLLKDSWAFSLLLLPKARDTIEPPPIPIDIPIAESKKEKALFRSQRKAVEAGAHGTLEYTIKKGVNKNKIADDKILKSKK